MEVCCCRKNREEGEGIAEGGGLSLSRVVCCLRYSDALFNLIDRWIGGIFGRAEGFRIKLMSEPPDG